MTYEHVKSYNRIIMGQDKTVMISAILLAAGESKRMGQLKQLMPFGEITILERTIDNLLSSKVSEIIVVLGHEAENVRKTISAIQVKIVINPEYKQGMSTSLITGLKPVARKTQAIMIVLGDLPFVDSKTIDDLIDAFTAGGKGIVIPVYQGKRGHPVIFSIEYRNELLALKGDVGAREIIERNPGDILEVSVDCEGVCVDIDTIDNYQLIIEKSINNKPGGKPGQGC